MFLNKQVMIIEDDDMLANFYAAFIKREFELESVICNSGKEAEDVLHNEGVENFLFFICDLNIPIDNEYRTKLSIFQGFELIEYLLPSCRTIIASGYISPEIAKKARDLGVVSIFQKPPNLNALAIVINFLLNCVIKEKI